MDTNFLFAICLNIYKYRVLLVQRIFNDICQRNEDPINWRANICNDKTHSKIYVYNSCDCKAKYTDTSHTD